MSSFNHKTELLESGFSIHKTLPVAIPYQIYNISMMVEFDRELGLTQLTILKLVDTGVTNRDHIAELMGLVTDDVFRKPFISLLKRNFINYIEGCVYLTSLGKQVLSKAQASVRKRYNRKILYDAYYSKIEWYEENSYLSQENVKKGSFNLLPEVSRLMDDDVKMLFDDIQILIKKNGIPEVPKHRQVNLLFVDPLYSENVYKSADLELWTKQQDTTWRLVNNSLELYQESTMFRQLEVEGTAIIP